MGSQKVQLNKKPLIIEKVVLIAPTLQNFLAVDCSHFQPRTFRPNFFV